MLGQLKENPLPVEITNQTDWWVPYVPPAVGLFGSILVAAVAIYSVRKSNKTNELAIEAADTRDRENWHRDNLLRICSEAVRVSRDIANRYIEAAAVSAVLANPEDFDDAHRQHLDEAQAAIDKVAPLSYDMMLLGETELSVEFQEIRQAGEYVAPAFRQFHKYLVANHERLRAAQIEGGATLDAFNAEMHEALEWKRYHKARMHLSHVSVVFQFAATKRISPQSLPKDAPDTPARFDPVITPEKHPDLFYPPPGASNNPFRRPSPFDWNVGDTADPPPKEAS